MVKEIYPNLFRIEIPLPDSPLKYLNAYVVRSPDRNLLIDTGLNRKICMQTMQAGLQFIGIDLRDTDIFITHFHADHFSLVPQLITPTTAVYFNRTDAERAENWNGFAPLVKQTQRYGFPSRKLKRALAEHPASRFGTDWVPSVRKLEDGYELKYGNYAFQCIMTPGHTPGHTCLYEPEKKILVSGDHILVDITPNIQGWEDGTNPLRAYLGSLKKVDELSVDLVLPGHRRLFSDHRHRIDELITHHKNRLAEVLAILGSGSRTAYETATQMTWDLRADHWDAFPLAQQWFATGESLAHIRYLEEDGQICRREVNGIVNFELV